MTTRKYVLLVWLCLLVVLAACGGRGEAEPTAAAAVDTVATSVRQTVEAIAVAQTVTALTTPQGGSTPQDVATPQGGATSQPLDTPTTAGVATAQPTTAVLPSPTLAPPLPTSTAVLIITPTIAPPTATATKAPPIVQNDPPGGSFPEDGSVFFNIIVDPAFLFRLDVRDLVPDQGNFEGAGIESVQFSISGNGVNYFREERMAGYCVFGGGEPTCNPWPVNEQGQYTWGADGPVVQSGDYFVNMAVTATDTSDEFSGNWNWNFDFTVTVP